MTVKSLKESQRKNGTHATTVEPYMKHIKKKESLPLLKSTLTVLNDLYLVKEDEMALEGNEAVVTAISSGKLHVPEAYEAFYKKVPYTGTVIAKGDKTKYDIPLGSKIFYGKFAVQRFEHEGEKLLIVREKDVHGIVN